MRRTSSQLIMSLTCSIASCAASVPSSVAAAVTMADRRTRMISRLARPVCSTVELVVAGMLEECYAWSAQYQAERSFDILCNHSMQRDVE